MRFLAQVFLRTNNDAMKKNIKTNYFISRNKLNKNNYTKTVQSRFKLLKRCKTKFLSQPLLIFLFC
jgi:hypothetical protein